jgi:hypothetical protein
LDRDLLQRLLMLESRLDESARAIQHDLEPEDAATVADMFTNAAESASELHSHFTSSR